MTAPKFNVEYPLGETSAAPGEKVIITLQDPGTVETINIPVNVDGTVIQVPVKRRLTTSVVTPVATPYGALEVDNGRIKITLNSATAVPGSGTGGAGQGSGGTQAARLVSQFDLGPTTPVPGWLAAPAGTTGNAFTHVIPGLSQVDQDGLYGPLSIPMTLAAGRWAIYIYTVEDNFTATGQRVFDVMLNGAAGPIVVDRGVDIFARVGKNVLCTLGPYVIDSVGTVTLTMPETTDHGCLTSMVANPVASTVALSPVAPLTPVVVTPPTVPTGSTAVAQTKLYNHSGGSRVTNFDAFETYLGRAVAGASVNFAVSDSGTMKSGCWKLFLDTTDPWYQQQKYLTRGLKMLISCPLAFGSFVDTSTAADRAVVKARLDSVAAGQYDADYIYCANAVVNGGYPNAGFRLGWEGDGTWMPWSAPGSEASFIAAYRHIHDVLRSVSPGFTFDLCGTAGYLENIGDLWYPGDAYVDSISIDFYDQGLYLPYNSSTGTWTNQATAWTTGILPHLQFHRDYAFRHGKPLGYGEWAVSGGGYQFPTNHGGDNVTFIQNFHDWLNQLPATGPASVLYHAYFNEDPTTDGPHTIYSGSFPNAATRFKSIFA